MHWVAFSTRDNATITWLYFSALKARTVGFERFFSLIYCKCYDGLIGEHQGIHRDLLMPVVCFHSKRSGHYVHNHHMHNTYPIHHSQVHPHFKGVSMAVYPLGQVG